MIEIWTEPDAAESGARDLLERLDDRADAIASSAFRVFSAGFPPACRWPESKRVEFLDRAKGRVQAILAATELGGEVGDDVLAELRGVGASAARCGVALDELLVGLRLSRDLVVQNAVEIAGGGAGGGHPEQALALLLTRLIPATDRLGDAITQGYCLG